MASTEHRFSHQPQHEPQRLSGVYQYHNAPEVLPEHGLEYDDNVYPVSDKYPVTSMDDYPSSFNTKYRDVNKPPRIIFGMKVRSFMLVALVFVLIVVGAVVGGTVGRNQAHANAESLATDQSPATSTTTSEAPGVRTIAAASSSTTPTSTRSTSSALSTPTISPLSACPSANDTSFLSTYSTTSNATVGLNFTRYCDVVAPADFETLTTAFVYTLDDCVEVCAGYNFYAGNASCEVAVYDLHAPRPANCVVGRANATSFAELNPKEGVAVALLKT